MMLKNQSFASIHNLIELFSSMAMKFYSYLASLESQCGFTIPVLLLLERRNTLLLSMVEAKGRCGLYFEEIFRSGKEEECGVGIRNFKTCFPPSRLFSFLFLICSSF